MITIQVKESDKIFAKKQIAEFEKTVSGNHRYKEVESWRGIVCEMLTSDWLESSFNVSVKATGLVFMGKDVTDDYDMIINNKKVEIKSATKNHFKYIMPKVYCVNNKPKDVYIGSKYNETTEPNQVLIIGWIYRKEIFKYPVEKNKGGEYYKIPLQDLTEINISKKAKLRDMKNYINSLKWYPNTFGSKEKEIDFWLDISDHYDIPLPDKIKNAFDYIKKV
tara:strand:- start:5203 stop:5865 length:663 start_codon:yes stop_codon:yes gene_type:complete